MNQQDYEDVLNRLDYLETENKRLKDRLDGIVENINQMVRVNDLEFPDGGV